MHKLYINIILLVCPLLGFSQNYSGKYLGIAQNDTLGRMEIVFNLYPDSTYEITVKFDYHGTSEEHCKAGETWTYCGDWLAFEEYIFFKPCQNGVNLIDSTKSSHCLESCQYNFDFDEISRTQFKSKRKKLKYEKKLAKISDLLLEKGYTERLKLEKETMEIFFCFGFDCYVGIWANNSVKKLRI